MSSLWEQHNFRRRRNRESAEEFENRGKNRPERDYAGACPSALGEARKKCFRAFRIEFGSWLWTWIELNVTMENGAWYAQCSWTTQSAAWVLCHVLSQQFVQNQPIAEGTGKVSSAMEETVERYDKRHYYMRDMRKDVITLELLQRTFILQRYYITELLQRTFILQRYYITIALCHTLDGFIRLTMRVFFDEKHNA